MQEYFETMKEILNDIQIFLRKSDDLKAEIIEQLIMNCPQKIYLTVEEYTVQEEIKHYLSQLNEISIEELNTIYKSYSFFQTMELILGDKLGIFSDETFEWIIEIDSALRTFTSLPTRSVSLYNSIGEEFTFSDDNDISS
ncbi:MAG: hypothetical protein KBG67_02475 [Candidatus Atribacteria bacterium]|nr:hypothetical protein [Candidatus Atribacteria bacterium]